MLKARTLSLVNNARGEIHIITGPFTAQPYGETDNLFYVDVLIIDVFEFMLVST